MEKTAQTRIRWAQRSCLASFSNLSTEGKARLPKLEELGHPTLVMEWQGRRSLGHQVAAQTP